MALLTRFSKLNDRAQTGVFSFIVTKSVTRGPHREATTKDFCFGYHRWAVSFQRPDERLLGVHLLLRNPSPNTACLVDFTLTLLNRQHFSHNRVYHKRQAKFTITNSMQGVARWLPTAELAERHFSNETGEFLFELSLANVATSFECDIQLGPSQLAHYKAGLGRGAAAEPVALETNCFSFGAFDWSLTVVGVAAPQPACRVYLNRLSGLESLCRVRYRVALGRPGAGAADSGALDQLSERDGRIRGHQFRAACLLALLSVRQAAPEAAARHSSLELRVRIDMLAANPVSEALVALGPRAPAQAQAANCSDRNKQAWCVEADCETDEWLRLKLFFLEPGSVPRNHVRYISWLASVQLQAAPGEPAPEARAVRRAPHHSLYLQDGADLGTIMDTGLAVKELQPHLLGGRLSVRVEWLDSLLLFSHLYNHYDALATGQRHQLSRELAALQHECQQLQLRYQEARRALREPLPAPPVGGRAAAGAWRPAPPEPAARRRLPAQPAELAAIYQAAPGGGARPQAGPAPAAHLSPAPIAINDLAAATAAAPPAPAPVAEPAALTGPPMIEPARYLAGQLACLQLAARRPPPAPPARQGPPRAPPAGAAAPAGGRARQLAAWPPAPGARRRSASPPGRPAAYL